MNFPAAKTITSSYCFVIAAVIFLFCSCVTKYPRNTPFVYETNINIQGKYSAEEKKVLEDQMYQQLHDSIRSRWQNILFLRVLKKPPVFDSLNVGITERYMQAMMNALGYMRDSVESRYKIDSVGDQYRTTINFDVYPNKLFRLDSLWYDLQDSVAYLKEIDTLQKLLDSTAGERVIQKGDPFSQFLISSELDRISDLARNNGYLKFTKEQLLAVWDTVGRNILSATTDVTEQLRQLEKLRLRRENPTTDLEIRLRPNVDSSKLTRFYVGEVRVYPDTDIDTLANKQYTPTERLLTENGYRFISYRNLFKPHKLTNFIYLNRGGLYRQSNYLRTQNRFSSLPAWRLVTINQLPREGTDTVDFDVLLVPNDKLYLGVNTDVSRNQGNIAFYGANVVGLGANLTLINRNFARAANLATTNFRYGIELGTRVNTVQTQQFLLSHTIQFPRLLPKLQWLPVSQEQKNRASTYLAFSLSSTDRRDYYRVFALNTSLAYEFSWGKNILAFRPLNLEYNILERRDSLDKLIETNKSYRYIFNDGILLSSLVNFTRTTGRKYVTNVFRGSAEFAGLISGPIMKAFFEDSVYRFIKVDAEFIKTVRVGAKKRNSIAVRGFGGVGYGLPFSNENGDPDSINVYMPFFRQYFAGGPNSMRAWTVRRLGPGSALESFGRTNAPDRFGDMRLELNFEWRYFLAQLFNSYPLEGALFTDVGNVWFLRKNLDFTNGEFNIKRLYRDLAVGVGTGFRVDFSFLLLRFDFAWKAKNPSPDETDAAAQNKWFYKTRLFGNYGAQFQLGINYPF